jgi:pimeloyl-ACP methyl ester carboxylesterase
MCRRATYVFVPGAGGDAWYWHLAIPEARARGHDVVAVSLQAGDDSAGWTAYADTIVDAIGDRTGVIVVAQSLAGFSAPMVCGRVPVDLLVLLNAMIPRPGETGADWWSIQASKRRCTPTLPPLGCRERPPTTTRPCTSMTSRGAGP